MIHDMPRAIRERMRFLEELNARQRQDEPVGFERLRQIPPVTGKFLALLAFAAPGGSWIEIGTSGGYSALWLSLAARERGARLTTFEISEKKVGVARETFRLTGVDDVVELVHGDALDHLKNCADVAFCFLDTEKDLYGPCYDAVVPRMAPGGILAADNVISHEEVLGAWSGAVLGDPRLDALIVPVGSGVLVARKV
ncbi:MAG: O-methyltransferase [Candidatus Eisenbacteria bacterium]